MIDCCCKGMNELINNSALQQTGLSSEELFRRFKEQLLKDFEMCQASQYLKAIENNSFDNISMNILGALEKLEKSSPSTYQNLLYRVDISEQQISKALKEDKRPPLQIISDLIIKRILQKVILKAIYSK